MANMNDNKESNGAGTEDVETGGSLLENVANESKNLNNRVSFVEVWPQIFASLVSVSSNIQVGISLALSGVLIPELANDESILDYTADSASWIASILTITQPVGALMSSLMDAVGRKSANALSLVPITLGWVIMYFTTSSLHLIYVGRFLHGIGNGVAVSGAIVYIAEIAHPQFRSMLLALSNLAVALGVLLVTFFGAVFHWRTNVILFAAMSCSSLAAMSFIPESPYWLARFSKRSEEYTKKRIRYLNRSDRLFDEAWSQIRERQRGSDSESRNFLTKIKGLTERSSRIPVLLILLTFLLQQISGSYVIFFYSVNIFQSLGNGLMLGMTASVAAVIIGVVRFLMTFMSVALSKFIGRTTIMTFSSLCMCLSAGIAGLAMSLNNVNTVNFGRASSYTTNITSIDKPPLLDSLISNVALVAILCHTCAAAVGMLVIPWSMPTELLPLSTRAAGNGLTHIFGTMILFVVIKTFPSLLDIVSLPTIFYFYSAVSLLTAVFVKLCIPETLNKNFEEIAAHFIKKK